MTFYESKFLKRSKYALVHEQVGQKSTRGKGEGKVARFNRSAPLSTATTPLTEGSHGNESSISTSTVDITLAEYGNWIKPAKFFKLTSIDPDCTEKVEVVGQNMGETFDELARDALYSGGTAQLASGVSALSDVAVTDTFDSDEVRKSLRTLETNKAQRFDDGLFRGIVGPYTKYDLRGDSTWINAHTYSDTKELYRGEIGELHGVRFLETANQKTESSTVTVYSNFIMGKDSFGVYNLEGDLPKLYIKTPNASDTSNPLDRYSTIGWAGSYVAKVLIATWVINVKTGATQ